MYVKVLQLARLATSTPYFYVKVLTDPERAGNAGSVGDLVDGAGAEGEDVVGEWTRTYPRELGLYPSLATRTRLYFPPVSRIDSAYGDRHLVCSCEPLENYAREVVTNGG